MLNNICILLCVQFFSLLLSLFAVVVAFLFSFVSSFVQRKKKYFKSVLLELCKIVTLYQLTLWMEVKTKDNDRTNKDISLSF